MMGYYTFSKGFYEEGEERFYFMESLRWNKTVLIGRIKRRKMRVCWKLTRISRGFSSFITPIYRKLELEVKTKIILFKLRDKEDLRLEYSPLSESRYVTYLYLDSCVKIRISMHGHSKNDNSDIYIYA